MSLGHANEFGVKMRRPRLRRVITLPPRYIRHLVYEYAGLGMDRVEVLYHYESTSEAGKNVNVHAGEKFYLLHDQQDANGWAFVGKTLDEAKGFYLPREYLRSLPTESNGRGSVDRRSAFLPSEAAATSFHAPGNRRSVAKGFKIADPKLAAKSIPADLNFSHNIPDLAAMQDVTSDSEEEHTYGHIANGRDGPEHQYQNLDENRLAEAPPLPLVNQRPVRELADGWSEFVDEVGRSFYFHTGTEASTWKPPRGMKSPEEVAALLEEPPDEQERRSLDDDGYSSQMTGSNESGAQSRSLTLTNKAYGLPPPPSLTRSDLHRSTEGLAGYRDDFLVNSASIAAAVEHANNIHTKNAIKSGAMEHCRCAMFGKKVKKVWAPCFIVLTAEHVFIYKDEEASKKKGAHYSTPQGVCDLRGGRIEWKEKDGKRKNIFALELIKGDVYLWWCPDDMEANSWYNEMRKVLSSLPYPKPYGGPEMTASMVDPRTWKAGSLRVLPSSSSFSPPPVPSASPPSSPNKSKDKKRSTQMSGSFVDETPLESRESILEKLRKLFRSRPSIDTLREKGIYKPEPVFGSTLLEICKREQATVPKFIRVCTATIERKGLDQDGLYRISGNLSQIQKIRCQVDQDEYTLLEGEEDIHVLSGALKLFFRELQDPLFPLSLSKEFLDTIRLPNGKTRVKSFRELIRRMPVPHQDTLLLLLQHLARVAAESGKNRMQAHNLAIVFGPTLFSPGNKAPPPKGKKKKEKVTWRAGSQSGNSETVVTSNSHLAFSMIMQGQVVEFLLKEFPRIFQLPSES